MPSPFPSTSSIPGKGDIHLTLLPPSTPTFSHLTYTYPLKLLPSIPHNLPPRFSKGPPSSSDSPGQPPFSPETVPLLFLLTYGGGLVAGDHIDLSVHLDAGTRLTVTTQGSTKIFKPSASAAPTTRQDLSVRVCNHAALWMAPDPVQPFAGSLYAQKQTFHLERGGSLGFVDWVSEGRKARGERWAFAGWRGRNEIWEVYGEELQRSRMLVRDAVVLDGKDAQGRMDGMGVFGTVLLRGPLLEPLADFFVEEFKALPRIGGRNWTNASDTVQELTTKEEWRKQRLQREKGDGLLWTACHVRGCTIIKFAAKEVEGAKAWLGNMLKEEGSVGREFGDGGLMFVR
ncbi:MAG: hypothetical protein Q9161_007737 [Pseudevernia consocians]